MVEASTASASTDGRHARSRRNREAVARAALQWVRETGREPDPVEIARRAGVSRRTLFRLFDDLEALHVEANRLQRAEVLERFPPPMPQGRPLEQRLSALVAHRAALYDYIMPLRVMADRKRHDSEVVERDLRESRRAFRMHMRIMLGDAVDDCDEALLHALEVQSSWYTWRALRLEQGCSTEVAAAVVENTMRALLGLPAAK